MDNENNIKSDEMTLPFVDENMDKQSDIADIEDPDNKKIREEEEEDKERKKKLSFYFNKIENYFKEKEQFIKSYKHIPVEDIFKNAPKYYSLIDVMERLNVFLTKNKDWLKFFIKNLNIKFDFDSYQRWKASKKFENFKYSITQVPSKWIHIIQDFLIEILEYLQILLILEFYINEEDYKAFLKANPKLFFKLKANFIKPSTPSDNLDLIFETIDFLLNINMANNFPVNHVVDIVLCIRVYKKIDSLKIFDLLKSKYFYIKFRLEYLKNVSYFKGSEIMYKDNIINVAGNFLKAVDDLVFNYNEYKKRLIEKHQTFLRTNKM
jgi:hypothetical protein